MGFDYADLRSRFAETAGASKQARIAQVCKSVGCCRGTVERAINRRDGIGSGSPGQAKPTGHGKSLRDDHLAVVEGTTLFRHSVISANENVLKPGKFSAKLGEKIDKGPFRGRAIFSLSLDERASCPRSCLHWNDCFGNNMPWAKRYRHGPELEARLPLEVGAKLLDHPNGIAIRLHTLGDFYSWRYVYLWRDLLETHDRLMVFGFTAHVDERDPITRAVAHCVRTMWPRFAIRFSNGDHDRCTTVSIARPQGCAARRDHLSVAVDAIGQDGGVVRPLRVLLE